MMTHDEYVSWQTIYQMSAYEREEVDTIVTSLMNLGMEATIARRTALCNYRDIVRGKMARADKNLGVIA
jgi:hypothetical protein